MPSGFLLLAMRGRGVSVVTVAVIMSVTMFLVGIVYVTAL